MWTRKNRLERGIETLESGAVSAVEELADTVRQRFDNEAGRQLAGNLTQFARNVEQLDLGDSMLRRRKELERATRKANRRVNRAIKDLDKTRSRVAHDANALAHRVGESATHGGQQLATIGQKAVPAEPTGWVMPIVLGFLLGFGAGFLVARRRRRHRDA